MKLTHTQSQDYYTALKILADTYHSNLVEGYSPAASRAYKYLIRKRGITSKTINYFKIGYCEKGIGYAALTENCLSDKHLIQQLGMFYPQKVEDTPTERFDSMLTFPVYYRGEVVHFSGRYVDDDWVVKDMFSPHKHKLGMFDNCYNQDVLDGDKKVIIAVESPLDAMTLHQQGFYSIATFGVNGVSEKIAIKLKGHDVYICYDNDENNSGMAGARKFGQLLSEFQIASKIILLPRKADKMDINEFFKTHTVVEFENLINSARPYKPEAKRQQQFVNGKSLDIMPVVRKYLKTVRKINRGYMCVCPFHSEHKPSFHIFTDKNEYFCYGCGRTGNTLQLLMRIEEAHGNDISPKEAVELYNTL